MESEQLGIKGETKKMEGQLFNLLKKYYYSIIGLLLGIPLIAVSIIIPLDGFLEKGIPRFFTRLFIYCGIYLIWVILWLILRNYYPKKKEDKIGIVFAIKTENDKQKLLIKNDFAEGIQKLLKENNLLSLFDTIVLQDYKANKALGILKNYLDKKSEYIREDKFKDFYKTKENKIYEKLNRKVNGHFYVWGEIKKRQDTEPTYYISLDALVVHRPIPIKASTKITQDFLAVFPKKISFYEKLEVRGFEIASHIIYMAIRYVTGIAAFVSGDIFVAYKLHYGLQNEIEKHTPIPPNLVNISKRLKEFLYLELVLQAMYFYHKKQDFNKFKELLTEAEKLNDKDYTVLVLNSLRAFVIDRDPLKSLQYLRKARRVHEGEYTWLYNKAFIFMYLEKFELGYKDYKRLRGLSFAGEDSIVDQCINFNKELIKNEPDKKQTFFILGYLYFTKKKNLPMALDNFEKFMKDACADSKYDYLCTRAVTYINDIKTKMGL